MKKKIIMTLLASTLIVGSMTGCGSTKLTKSSITIELGNEDAIKISDFLDLSKDELKNAKLNTKDVNFFKEGNYKATISYKDKDYDIKVKVKDTVAPKITVSDNIVVQTNTPLHMSDIITEVTELSGNIDASFKDKPKSESTESTEKTDSTESTENNATGVIAVGGCNLKHNDEITYTKSGDYDNTITVTDDAGNTSNIDVKISVIDAPSINGISDKTVTVGDAVDYLSDVSAVDGKGTDITGSIEVDSSKVDINTPGTYQITYKVTDSYGFSTGANCNITVNEKKEEVADNTSDGNDNTTTSDKGNKKTTKKNKGSNSNTASNNNSSNGSSSSNNSGSNTSNGSTSTANNEPNDGKKTFTSSFGETIRTNPNNYKYDTKYAAEFYPKGFWANGECLTMDELSDARQGKNEAAARYMLAGGDPNMTQERFDQKYLSDEEFYAKYGWHLY
ncbi:immunoglobulin-like domain-containing protein [Agathobacter rectalis]|nr:immunoglobulin-like domain-containing protein [Agathobacter rectalis]